MERKSFTRLGRLRGEQRRTPLHPPGFYALSVLVLLERFAGYILSSTLVLYLSKRMGSSPAEAARVSGWLNAMGYVGALPGGFAADRLLGHRRAVAIGTLCLALGYALLASDAGMLWPALLALGLGSALFRPNSSALLGYLYKREAVGEEAAQTGLYVAANAGATLGALVAGILVRQEQWNLAFWLASFVMAGCWLFIKSSGALVKVCGRPSAVLSPPAKQEDNVRPGPESLTRAHRIRILAALVLAGIVYAIGYGQVEGALLIWAQERTNRRLYGFEVPAAWFIALLALWVLCLGYAQLRFLRQIRQRVRARWFISMGLLSMAAAFAVLLPATSAAHSNRVSMGWFLTFLPLFVVGESLVVPLSMSWLRRMAPTRLAACGLGSWYVALAVGSWLAGEIGALFTRWPMGEVLGLLILLSFLSSILVLCSGQRGYWLGVRATRW